MTRTSSTSAARRNRSRLRIGVGILAAHLAGGCLAAVPLVGASVPAVSAAEAKAAAKAKCMGKRATIVGTARGDKIRGTRRADVIVARGGDDTIRGKGGADLICAGGGDDIVLAGGGANRVKAGGGSDIVIGGSGADRIWGQGGVDGVIGGSGKDRLDGGPSVDLLAYLGSRRGVRIDLAKGRATGDGTDRLSAFEAVVDSRHADTLRGSKRPDAFFLTRGADRIRAGRGRDYVVYTLAERGVRVNLSAGVANGGSVSGVEHVVGSAYDDVITGSAGFNELDGAGGTDRINGMGGDDICSAEQVAGCRDDELYSELPPAPPGPPARASSRHGELGAALERYRARAVRPPSGAKVPLARAGTEYGSVMCPSMSRYATATAWVLGTGALVIEGGDGAFVTEPMYYNGSQTWVWKRAGYWVGPYNAMPTIPVFVGQQALARAWWYSYDTGGYAFLGSCVGNGPPLGLF